MLQAWRLAQNYCDEENCSIPLSQFLCLTDSELLLECDLVVLIQANTKQTPSKAKQTILEAKQDEAIASNCYVYVRGTEKHHKWLAARREAGRSGGVKSAKRPRGEKGTLQANTKQTLSKTQQTLTKAKQTQPSYSYSSSYSIEERDIEIATETWRQSLSLHKIEKDANLDRSSIVSLLETHGLDQTLLALRGAAFEDRSPTYDPSKHMFISRLVLNYTHFEKCVNLGAQNKPQKREYHEDTTSVAALC